MKIAIGVCFIILQGFLVSRADDCPRDWFPYEAHKSCILDMRQRKAFASARKACQTKGGDLVQIWDDEDKETFINELLVNQANRRWIGLGDLDNDGMYEWINGTKHVFDPPKARAQEKMCVQYSQGEKVIKPCMDDAWYICEKFLNPQKTAADPSACTMRKCNCQKKDWLKFKEGNEFIKISKAAETHSDAGSFCKRQGGRLLTVRSKRKVAFVLRLSPSWQPVNIFYWMGLQRVKSWKWSDGLELKVADLNWRIQPTEKLNCAGVIWSHSAGWLSTYCSSKYYYICESKNPCSAFPVVRIEGTKTTSLQETDHGETVTLTNEQEAMITCFGSGATANLHKVDFRCYDTPHQASGKLAATIKATINIDMHHKSCLCYLTHKDGFKSDLEFKINFLTRPRLVKEEPVIEFTGPKPGKDITMTFDLYANPEPELTDLIKRGSAVSKKLYKTSIELGKKQLHYTLNITMAKFSKSSLGNYVMTIANGIQDNLKQKFVIQDPDMVIPEVKVGASQVRIQHGGNLTVKNEHELDIICLGRGNTQRLSGVQFNCPDTRFSGKGNPSVTTKLFIDIKMHNKTCMCTLTLKNQSTIDTNFTIHYLSRPRLVKKMKEVPTHLVTVGKTFATRFEIYANPKPVIGGLTWNGTLVNDTDYEAAIQIVIDKPLYYHVKILISNFQKNLTGPYTLTIENGIPTKLNYFFGLEEGKPSHNEVPSAWYIWLLLMSILLSHWLLSALCNYCLCAAARRRQSEDHVDTTVDDMVGNSSLAESSVPGVEDNDNATSATSKSKDERSDDDNVSQATSDSRYAASDTSV